MTISIYSDHPRPTYAGLPLGFAAEAIEVMSSYRLNILAHVLAVAQMRGAAPNRARGGQPQDERLTVDLGWLMRTCGRSGERTIEHVKALTEIRIDEGTAPLVSVKVLHSSATGDQSLRIVVHRAFAYPSPFAKIPLPLLTGDKVLARAYLEVFGHLHHSGERAKALMLSDSLNGDDLVELNQHIKRLNHASLRGHVTIPRRVARRGLQVIYRDGRDRGLTVRFDF